MAWVATVVGVAGAAGSLLGGGAGGGSAPPPPPPTGPQTITFGNKGTPSWVLPSIIGVAVVGAVVVVVSLNKRK
jgi:hypothetical protein